MEKKRNKTLLGIVGLGLGVLLLSSCTANFCSVEDFAEMAYPYEQGVTVYGTKSEYDSYFASENFTKLSSDYPDYAEKVKALSGPLFTDDSGNAIGDIYKYVPVTGTTSGYTFDAAKASEVNTIISSLGSNNLSLPSIEYWAYIDQYVIEGCIYQAYANSSAGSSLVSYEKLETPTDCLDNVSDDFIASITLNDVSNGSWCVNPYKESDTNGTGATAIPLNLDDSSTGNSLLRYYGGSIKYYEFFGSDYLESSNYSKWVKLLRVTEASGAGLDGTISDAALNTYHSTVYSLVSSQTSCITSTGDTYGHYGTAKDWEVAIEAKDWSYAWNKGFLEGLLVYPVSCMVDFFSYAIDPALSGFGQIWAIVIVALIIRIVMAAITIPSTLSQQRMTALQPQLAKIQAKYPNANTNQAEKMRLAQEQQALYKRNNVHMFAPFLVMLIQFPVFICVWSGMRGSAALSSGSFLNLSLSDTISSVLTNFSGSWYANTTGWWTALLLFLIMCASQLAAILVPQIITKRRNAKNSQRLGKNPNLEKQNKTMKWMTWGMYAMTVIMGFMLPSAMGVYWTVGAVVSLGQSMLVQWIASKTIKKKGNK